MIRSDIEINFENGEIIRISNEAILSLSFHTAGTQYSFSDETTRVDTEVDKLNELIEKTWQSNAFGNCRQLTDRRIQSLVTTAMLQAIDELPKPACPRYFH